jgi:signal transduction histidine kinase
MDSISINSLLLKRFEEENMKGIRKPIKVTLSDIQIELENLERHVEDEMEIAIPLENKPIKHDIINFVKNVLPRWEKISGDIFIDFNPQLSETAYLSIYEKAFSAAISEIIRNCIQHAFPSNIGEKRSGKQIIAIRGNLQLDKYILTIADNGNGISANNMQHIFLPGWKMSNRLTDSGMGLAHVKNIIQELHKGDCFARVSVAEDFSTQYFDKSGDVDGKINGLAIEISLPIKDY